MIKKISIKKVVILTIIFTFSLFLSTLYAESITYDDATIIAEQKAIELSSNNCGDLLQISVIKNNYYKNHPLIALGYRTFTYNNGGVAMTRVRLSK